MCGRAGLHDLKHAAIVHVRADPVLVHAFPAHGFDGGEDEVPERLPGNGPGLRGGAGRPEHGPDAADGFGAAVTQAVKAKERQKPGEEQGGPVGQEIGRPLEADERRILEAVLQRDHEGPSRPAAAVSRPRLRHRISRLSVMRIAWTGQTSWQQQQPKQSRPFNAGTSPFSN
jgi:hypothetical protein